MKRPGIWPGRSTSLFYLRLAAVADKAQQEQEQVDEVEIEREGAHHRLAAGDRAVVADIVHLLDALSIPGGQPGEDQHADRRDGEVEPGGLEEDVDDHGQDQPEQAHPQERADRREIALRDRKSTRLNSSHEWIS